MDNDSIAILNKIDYNYSDLKNEVVKSLRDLSLKLAERYDGNIKIEIDTNVKMKSSKIKITEFI
jgi:hypothetical protein